MLRVTIFYPLPLYIKIDKKSILQQNDIASTSPSNNTINGHCQPKKRKTFQSTATYNFDQSIAHITNLKKICYQLSSSYF
jgi:hypothetical protein